MSKSFLLSRFPHITCGRNVKNKKNNYIEIPIEIIEIVYFTISELNHMMNDLWEI
jgi:hypothetical protein